MHPILMYHGVGEPAPHGETRYNVTRETLAGHVAELRTLGRPVVPLPDLLQGTPGVSITFDDGEESTLTAAAPLLAAAGWVGTCYVTSDFVGQPGYLSAEQVRELRARGWTIGSHGRTHRFLHRLDDADLHDELCASRAALAAMTGTAVTHLSLPGGRGREQVAGVAAMTGYASVATSTPGLNQHLDPWRLERLVVGAETDRARVRRLVTGDPMTVARERLRVGALDAAKQALGDSRYERLRGLARALRRRLPGGGR